MRSKHEIEELRWKAFAAHHRMEEYRHGHGLLHGCFREVAGERFGVNQRVSGLEFVRIASERRVPQLLWADEAFVAWSRQPEQVSVSERAFHSAQQLGVANSVWADLRLRPYAATSEPLHDATPDCSRFRRLAGAHRATALCEPVALSALPSAVLIESHEDRLAIYFPLIADPELPLMAVLNVFGMSHSHRITVTSP